MTVYDFSVKKMDGAEVSLAEYRGKVLLIVNTATGCGFTPQYDALQDLYDAYKDRGLEILDFPCNQFGEQALGEDAEIHSFCTGRKVHWCYHRCLRQHGADRNHHMTME